MATLYDHFNPEPPRYRTVRINAHDAAEAKPIGLGAGTLYLDGKPIGGVTNATMLRSCYRPWGAHTHQLAREWTAFCGGITMTVPITPEAVRMALGPLAYLAYPPPRHYRPRWPGHLPFVDAGDGFLCWLDRLEREHMGRTWSAHLDVTRGDWFAMTLAKRPRPWPDPPVDAVRKTVRVAYEHGRDRYHTDVMAWANEVLGVTPFAYETLRIQGAMLDRLMGCTVFHAAAPKPVRTGPPDPEFFSTDGTSRLGRNNVNKRRNQANQARSKRARSRQRNRK